MYLFKLKVQSVSWKGGMVIDDREDRNWKSKNFIRWWTGPSHNSNEFRDRFSLGKGRPWDKVGTQRSGCHQRYP